MGGDRGSKVDAGLAGAGGGGAVGDAAGEVGPSVGAVGVEEDDRDRSAVERGGGGERRLLVGAAAAELVVGPEPDRALTAAADQHAGARERAPEGSALAGEPGEDAADGSGLLLEAGGEDDGLRPGLGRGRLHRVAGGLAGDDQLRVELDAGEVRVLGARAGEMGADALGHGCPESVPVEDRQRVGDGRPVRDARVGDHVEHVPGGVGDRQVDDLRGSGGERQAPTLEARDLLADRVDVVDRQPRGEHHAVELALVGGGDALGGKARERRAAAGEAGDQHVVGAEVARLPEQALGRLDAALVGERVGRLEQLEALEGYGVVAVTDDDGPPAEALAEHPLQAEPDLQARLAGAEDDDAATRCQRVADAVDDEVVAVEADEPFDREAGIARGEAGGGDPQRQLTRPAESVAEQLLGVADARGPSGLSRPGLRSVRGGHGRIHRQATAGWGKTSPG
ncbi:MAG: hypothetical protein U0R24_01695 [Solirubrobacterales bacterium]